MKRIIAILAVLGTAVLTLQAQGTISIANDGNTSLSPSATSGGVFYYDMGGGSSLLTVASLNVEVWGGPNAGSLSYIVTLSGANALGYSALEGRYLDFAGTTYGVPGVALSADATLQLYAWVGSDTTWAAAQASGALRAMSTFSNKTGGGGSPPATPIPLTGMPSMILVPEPSTLALAGLGAAALLLFRRRK